jgi:hypothetical protein
MTMTPGMILLLLLIGWIAVAMWVGKFVRGEHGKL